MIAAVVVGHMQQRRKAGVLIIGHRRAAAETAVTFDNKGHGITCGPTRPIDNLLHDRTQIRGSGLVHIGTDIDFIVHTARNIQQDHNGGTDDIFGIHRYMPAAVCLILLKNRHANCDFHRTVGCAGCGDGNLIGIGADGKCRCVVIDIDGFIVTGQYVAAD